MDDQVWDATVFTKNRERLRGRGRVFLERILAEAGAQHLLSNEQWLRAWSRRPWAPRSALRSSS